MELNVSMLETLPAEESIGLAAEDDTCTWTCSWTCSWTSWQAE